MTCDETLAGIAEYGRSIRHADALALRRRLLRQGRPWKRTVRLPGTGGLLATLSVTRLARPAQPKPDVGDAVEWRPTATARLALPVSEHNRSIYVALQFGSRVTLCGRYADSDWGYTLMIGHGRFPVCDLGTDGVAMMSNFTASTWAEAVQAARAYLLREVGRLVDALRARVAELRASARSCRKRALPPPVAQAPVQDTAWAGDASVTRMRLVAGAL